LLSCECGRVWRAGCVVALRVMSRVGGMTLLFECCNSCAGCRSYSPTAVSCPAGSFCPSGSPTPVLCGVGQYSEGGASVCSACPGGVYGNTTGLSNPVCSGLCSAGFMCPAGSTTPETQLCPSGRYSLPGAATCSNCRQEAVLLHPVISVLCCGVLVGSR
jgi:hypothetical protein